MVRKHIKNLENSLSVRLFNRTTRKLNLTDAGSSYYEKVNIILSEIDETESAISAVDRFDPCRESVSVKCSYRSEATTLGPQQGGLGLPI